jgi:hypothetical protein
MVVTPTMDLQGRQPLLGRLMCVIGRDRRVFLHQFTGDCQVLLGV